MNIIVILIKNKISQRNPVTPAKAGIQCQKATYPIRVFWTPAFAGMTMIVDLSYS